MLLSISIFAQTPVSEYRVATAGTDFTVNIPIGTKIYNIATGEYWVAVAPIAAGAGVNIGTQGAKLSILTAITMYGIDQTNIKLKTALTGTTPDAAATVTLPAAVTSAAGVGGSAGLLTATDKEKLNLLSTPTPSSAVGTFTTKTFEIPAGGASFAAGLDHPCSNTTSLTVSLNGSVLKESLYALDGPKTTVTVSVPVLQYDVIIVSYTF